MTRGIFSTVQLFKSSRTELDYWEQEERQQFFDRCIMFLQILVRKAPDPETLLACNIVKILGKICYMEIPEVKHGENEGTLLETLILATFKSINDTKDTVMDRALDSMHDVLAHVFQRSPQACKLVIFYYVLPSHCSLVGGHYKLKVTFADVFQRMLQTKWTNRVAETIQHCQGRGRRLAIKTTPPSEASSASPEAFGRMEMELERIDRNFQKYVQEATAQATASGSASAT